MIYYPLSVLMLAGIREIAMITYLQRTSAQFQRLLGRWQPIGVSRWSGSCSQSREGLAQAYILTEQFLAGSPSAVCVAGATIIPFFGAIGAPERMARGR